LGARNEWGQRLLQFCQENGMVIANTMFKHHPRRLYTWKSPGDRFRNQIDFIMVNARWRTSVTNCKTFPGAECGSDHQLLVMVHKLKLKSTGQSLRSNRLTREDLHQPREAVQPTLTNIKVESTKQSVEQIWGALQKTVKEAADKICKNKNKNKHKNRQHKYWITTETITLIEERKKIKAKGIRTEQEQTLYRHLCKQIQRCRQE